MDYLCLESYCMHMIIDKQAIYCKSKGNKK